MYRLRDPNPTYEPRRTTKGVRRVNTKLFDLKQQLRGTGAASALIHATDNIQETKDNLAALGIAYQPTRRFETVLDAFRALDAAPGLRYVVLRHGETALDAVRNVAAGISGFGIDLLVSDYFKAKTALDGESADAMHERYDNGGRGVRNFVSIGGYRVPFDLRTVGDGYLDARWQGEILEERVPASSSSEAFDIPSKEQGQASLLYHILVQKNSRDLPKDNPVAFLKSIYGLNFGSVDEAWKALNDFMLQRGYRIVHSTAFHSYRDPRRSS